MSWARAIAGPLAVTGVVLISGLLDVRAYFATGGQAGSGAVDRPPPIAVATAVQPRTAVPGPSTVPLAVTEEWRRDLTEDVGLGSRPVSVAIDRDGGILVADEGTRQLAKLNPDGKLLWKVAVDEGRGNPLDVAAVTLDPDGDAYVLDSDSGNIYRFSSGGAPRGMIRDERLSVYHPRGLALAADGSFYMANTGLSQVFHLDRAGKLLDTVGKRGFGRGELDQPTGVVVGGDGSVLVVDPVAAKVVRFDTAGAALQELAFFPASTAPGPQASLAADGTLWVADTANGRALGYLPAGQVIHAPPNGGLLEPSGIAAGPGFVIVTEPLSHIVRKLRLP